MSQSMMDRPIPLPWWKTRQAKRAWIIGGSILILLVAGLLLFTGLDGALRVARSDVTVSPVRRGLFRDFVPLRGTVEPRDTIYLDALAGGQVAELLVQAGDEVNKGQPLVVFRNEQLELNVLDNAGRLIQSATQVQTYETQLENNRVANQKALTDFEYNVVARAHALARYEPLLGAQAIPAGTVEQTRDQLAYYRRLRALQQATNRTQEAVRQRELPRLRAELLSLRRSLVATEAQLRQLVVRAPVSGRVTQLDLKIGENRDRGQRLAEIVPPTGFKIRADVDQFYLGRVRVGQVGEIALNGTTYRLRASRIYPEVKNGTFMVDLEFAGAAPADLSPGATADGKLSLGSDTRGLILPAGAFLDASGGTYAFVLTGDGDRAVRRPIRVGRRNQEQVVVRSGLQAGDRVITSDYGTFGQAQAITLTD